VLVGDIRHPPAKMKAFVLAVPYVTRQYCAFVLAGDSYM
jgi:hypothetical protein